ncbi:fimbria/pilus outer membrane usher protein, partial [Vibrio alfacsensis]|uniref:fimbria/pilus outer membrane usher protein n=1 Tax=Vibrio alfacsensis TaxID=1074311 RepID=UPI00406891EC
VSLSSNSRLYQSGQMTDTTTIRANAETNAEVRVYQDNELIHTEYVAAGEFTINDMNIRSNSDFVVSIKEEDGREAVFSVPSQLVLSVLKQCTSEHSLFTGLQRTNSHAFLGGELIYGLTDTQSLTTGLFV